MPTQEEGRPGGAPDGSAPWSLERPRSVLCGYPNWVRQGLVEQIALLVERHSIRLGVALDIGGSGHDGVLAGGRRPFELELGPRILGLRGEHPGVLPIRPAVVAPLHSVDAPVR